MIWLYQRTGLSGLMRAVGTRGGIFSRVSAMAQLAPNVSLSGITQRLPQMTTAKAQRRGRVGVLTGCVQDAFFGEVNAATVRVLAAEGYDVVIPPEQGCCGALSVHAGRENEGIRFARQVIDAFEDAEVDTIITNSAGCGSAMKEYEYLLRDDPAYADRAARLSGRVKDIAEVLAAAEPVAPRHPLPIRVAYHDACHLRHAQQVIEQPRTMLRTIPELQVVDLPESDICCGSAGIYNLTEPEAARALGERKAHNVAHVQPDMLAAGNPGCLLQITTALKGMGMDIPSVHPIQLVDASIRGIPVSEAVSRRK
jgi:glycolate oxidase iron-sulfur subunit